MHCTRLTLRQELGIEMAMQHTAKGVLETGAAAGRQRVQTKFVSRSIARVDLAPLRSRSDTNFRRPGLAKRVVIFALAWRHIKPSPARKVLTTRIQLGSVCAALDRDPEAAAADPDD
jgi:hypothetical protein